MLAFLAGLAVHIQQADTMVLGGDIMLNGIPVAARPLGRISSLLKGAGISLANLEVPLTHSVRPTPYKSPDELRRRTQFILKADPGQARGISDAGVKLVSLGNNHCMDYRKQGLEQMEGALGRVKVGYAGAGDSLDEALRPAFYTMPDGTRVGLISALAFLTDKALRHCTPATRTSAGVATLRFGGEIGPLARQELDGLISSAKRDCDILVIGLHWGVERQRLPTAYQVALGRACIDAGADIVWGNHPHVLQGAELYRGKPILYSMGNLVSTKGGDTGLIRLTYSKSEFLEAEFLPLEISGGRVGAVAATLAGERLASFKDLCVALERHYPSPLARPLIGFGEHLRSVGPGRSRHVAKAEPFDSLR